jgi:uncharacterized SAM-binding protein YcdF (DUF218 family)
MAYSHAHGPRWYRLILLVGVIAVVALGAGFFAFASALPRAEPKIAQPADGIVVLTGGASRIVDAVDLLAAGRGKRLLISGVHPTTTSEDLVRINPDFERLLNCCIDLGHEATNTIGNAVETARWVRDKGIRSLIIVTSAWHMPRALIEIEHEILDVELTAYPVVTDKMREQAWWADTATVRLLALEYVKYVASLVRVRLDPSRHAGSVSGSRS